jgi:TolB protein
VAKIFKKLAILLTNRRSARFALPALLIALPAGSTAEWTNRYPKVANVSHHVYLEGFNLPTLAHGPTDPAPSPDGRSVAIAAGGWLWVMDIQTREARRLTRGGGVDSRPAWSPDGRQIAFVRDSGRDTSIVLVDLASRRERMLVDTPAMDLDPSFSSDGRAIFYSSAEAGDLDLWRIELESRRKTRLTTARGLELQPQQLGGTDELAFVWKASSASDNVAILNLSNGQQRLLREEGIASQMRVGASPSGEAVAVTVPLQDRLQLLLLDAKGGPPVRLAHAARYPQTPSWSRDGAYIYYVQPDGEERFRLHRVAAGGGEVEELTPLSWELGEPTGRVTIRTRQGVNRAAARLSVTRGDGHPLVPPTGMARFDGQNGLVFFYSPGTTTFDVPAGTVRVVASHGFAGAREVTRRIAAGETAVIDIDLPGPALDVAARGWYSADLHSHLNYGGPYQLTPDDIVLDMKAEDLDLATPQVANLHTNLMDVEWWGWRRTERPVIAFAQEVRSHFLGHVALIGADAIFSPWFWGPGYPVYAALDLPNAAALRFARDHGGMNSYVHPVSVAEPFPANGEPAGMPLELVPDALLGDVDTIEVACLWSDELGTAEAWYRLLNLGLPIMPSAGSDTMHNFHRTMAIGSARIYARPEGALSLQSFLAAVKRGRSFVTNGPLIDFTAGGQGPGGVIAEGGGTVEWRLEAFSAIPVEKVEILVNGRVAWSGRGIPAGTARTFTGRVDVPRGGWVAARVHGGASRWPVQDSYPFAHSAPIWLGRVGSSDPEAARASSRDLLRWMTVAERRLNQGYPGAQGARLKARFAEARRLLEAR